MEKKDGRGTGQSLEMIQENGDVSQGETEDEEFMWGLGCWLVQLWNY